MRKLRFDFRELIRSVARQFAGARRALTILRSMGAALSIFAAAVCCILLPEAAAQPRVSEYTVKAAYLLNFGKFVRVPAGEQPPTFDICIVGHDPFGNSLDAISANEAIDGRPVRVLRLARAEAARGCAIAYIAAVDAHQIDDDIAALGAADVLTVSDAPDFLQHGGMIRFVLVSDHVRFAVNLDAVHRSHIVLSSDLLRVATSVTGGNGEVRP